MLHNSLKFLTLALAASLTVAPISAIDLNSNSSRWGLGLAIVGIAYIAYKWCFSGKNNPEQENNLKPESDIKNPKVATQESGRIINEDSATASTENGKKYYEKFGQSHGMTEKDLKGSNLKKTNTVSTQPKQNEEKSEFQLKFEERTQKLERQKQKEENNKRNNQTKVN